VLDLVWPFLTWLREIILDTVAFSMAPLSFTAGNKKKILTKTKNLVEKKTSMFFYKTGFVLGSFSTLETNKYIQVKKIIILF
jgi:hypothetical protein